MLFQSTPSVVKKKHDEAKDFTGRLVVSMEGNPRSMGSLPGSMGGHIRYMGGHLVSMGGHPGSIGDHLGSMQLKQFCSS